MINSFNFDKTDYKILSILHKNARVPLSAIANMLDLDVRTINKRIKRLFESGAARTTVVIDPAFFGYCCIVDIFLKAEPDVFRDYVQMFINDPRIPYVAVHWEQNQFSLEGRFRTNEEVYTFINNEIASLPGVRVLSYNLIPAILKNIDSWFPIEPDFEGDNAD